MTSPSKHFTLERLSARDASRLPSALFHFTQLDRALRIAGDGVLRGNPTVSFTENPSLSGPGPVVFVVDPRRVRAEGFLLLPHVWGKAAQEAEWRAATRNATVVRRPSVFVRSRTVELPVASTCIAVGFACHDARHVGKLEALDTLLRERGVRLIEWDWTQWWHGDGVSVPPGLR